MPNLPQPQGELTVLSYLAQYPELARDILRRAMVSEETFTDAACRDVFRTLMCDPSTSVEHLLGIVCGAIPAVSANLNGFLDLAPSPGNIEYASLTLSEHAILREFAAAQSSIMQRAETSTEFVLDSLQNAIADAQAKVAALRAEFSGASAPAAQSAVYTLDESLLHMPGFVDELADYSMCTAQRPNRTLSFAGALAMLAHLAARKFVGPNDSRPNIYLIALADSGAGKDWPRKVNRKVALEEHIEVSVQDDIASGQGLEDTLLDYPALLMQMDEFNTVLNVMKDEKANRMATEAMWKVMLTMFSSSGSTTTTRLRAATAKGGGGGKVIYNPSLSIFATAIPDKFYGSLCERALDSGFLARFLVMEAGVRGKRNPKAGMNGRNFPAPIMRGLRHLSSLGRRPTDNVEVDPRDITVVPFADGAEDEMNKVNSEADVLYDKAQRDGDDMAKSVWNRSLELVGKLALLYAISEGAVTMNGFAISRTAVKWAWRFVKALQLRMLEMAAAHTAVNPLDEKVQKVLRLVREAGERGIIRGVLSRKAHLSAREMDEVEATLVDRDEISVSVLPRGANGRTAKRYIPVKGK